MLQASIYIYLNRIYMLFKKGAQIRGSALRPRIQSFMGPSLFLRGFLRRKESLVGCGETPDAEEARQGVQYSGSHVISRGTGSCSPLASFASCFVPLLPVIVKSHANSFNGNIYTNLPCTLKCTTKQKKKRKRDRERWKKTQFSLFSSIPR